MIKVLAGGRFNIIHPGHIHFLKKAKALGTYLVVVVANDKTIKKQKKNLLFPAKERKKLIENFTWVDKTVIGFPIPGEEGYIKTIVKEKPDVIALGYDQHIDVPCLKKKLRSRGIICKIVHIKERKGFKTRDLINL